MRGRVKGEVSNIPIVEVDLLGFSEMTFHG